MAGLNTSFRALWFGTAALIPAGWTRDTDFDELYFVGDDVDASASGGNATHTHDLDDHGHPGNSHTHTVNGILAAAATLAHWVGSFVFGLWTGTGNHSHAGVSSNSASTVWETLVGLTSGASSSDPPYAKAIVIKPDDANQLVPTGAVTFWEDDADPIRCKFTDGTHGVDLRDKYIKGADAAGDGDATTPLGNPSHTHTSAHVHDEVAHGHVETDMAAASVTQVAAPAGAGAISILQDMHHGVTLNDNTPTDTTSDDANMDSPSNLVEYVRLAAIQQLAGDQALHTGMILLWVGDAVDLPADWLLCDGTNGTIDTDGKQIYVVNTKAEVGDTGGNVDATHHHNHAAHGHTASTVAHAHTATDALQRDRRNTTTPSVNVGASTAKAPHSHSWGVTDADRLVTNVTLSDSSEAEFRMPWRGVVFAKYEPVVTVQVDGLTSFLGSTAIAAA